MENPIQIQRFSNSSLRVGLSPTINGRKVQQAPVSPVSPLEANAVLRKLTNLLPYPLSWLEKEELEVKRPLTSADKKELRLAMSHINVSDQKAALTKAYETRVERCERPPVTHTEEMPILVIKPDKGISSLKYKGITVSITALPLSPRSLGLYVNKSKQDNYNEKAFTRIRIGLMALWTRKYLKST